MKILWVISGNKKEEKPTSSCCDVLSWHWLENWRQSESLAVSSSLILKLYLATIIQTLHLG